MVVVLQQPRAPKMAVLSEAGAQRPRGVRSGCPPRRARCRAARDGVVECAPTAPVRWPTSTGLCTSRFANCGIASGITTWQRETAKRVSWASLLCRLLHHAARTRLTRIVAAKPALTRQPFLDSSTHSAAEDRSLLQ
ncbi:hypothetical protein MTO96_003747 [Rhipicephalus appendiculatus]